MKELLNINLNLLTIVWEERGKFLVSVNQVYVINMIKQSDKKQNKTKIFAFVGGGGGSRHYMTRKLLRHVGV